MVATSQNYQPGSGLSKVDMRGYDNYSLGFICTTPSVWPDGKLPTNYRELNHKPSGGNPNSVMETQAGALADGAYSYRKHAPSSPTQSSSASSIKPMYSSQLLYEIFI